MGINERGNATGQGPKMMKTVAGVAKEINAAAPGRDEKVRHEVSNNAPKAGRKMIQAGIKKQTDESCYSPQSAMKIFYYVMAADGEITGEELAKFDEIGFKLYSLFNKDKGKILAEAPAQMAGTIDPGDRIDAAKEGIEEALREDWPLSCRTVSPELLIWDALTVAYSDANYGEMERNLIKYIVRKTNVDTTVFLEMESSLLTIQDIDTEIAWARSLERPLITRISELMERKNIIMNSIRELIAL